jgi:hypothetical protein
MAMIIAMELRHTIGGSSQRFIGKKKCKFGAIAFSSRWTMAPYLLDQLPKLVTKSPQSG